MAASRRGGFHPLRVAAIDPLTDDAVAVTLAVPPPLRETFRHLPGQHLTVRHRTDDGEIRRTYSICTPAADPAGAAEPRTLRIGVRLIEGGVFSRYVRKELAVGDLLETMAPSGRFVLDCRPGHFAAVVGGSGITPVLSMATTLLQRQPDARFCLLRCDRTAASTMFLEEVADLKDRWPDRFQLVSAMSREERRTGPASGRLDAQRLTGLLPALLPVGSVNGWFLCGPYGLVEVAARALRGLGVARGRIHQEIFHVDGATPAGPNATPAYPSAVSDGPSAISAERNSTPARPSAPPPSHTALTATLGGRSGTWPVRDGEPLLETVLRNRTDTPYACRGGVCGTCRAFLVSGEVRMDRNFALEREEVVAGYVLACQSRPVGERVELDFDR
jgi:ring-1,2-phenylacetyl-CoA epoxidase subunit PaaE